MTIGKPLGVFLYFLHFFPLTVLNLIHGEIVSLEERQAWDSTQGMILWRRKSEFPESWTEPEASNFSQLDLL